MHFEDSPLKWDADRIVYTGKSSGAYEWSVEFKLQDGHPLDLADTDIAPTDREQNGFFSPLRLTNIDYLRDYEKSAGEHINLQAVILSGMWLKVLLPARKYLHAHITRKKLTRVDGSWDEDEEIKTFIYKVLIKLDDSQTNETNSSINLTRRELDLRGFNTADIDLLDLAMEQMRGLAVGGTWRKATGQEVLQALYTKECEDLKVDGEKAVDGIEFALGANTQRREHIQIEQGMPFLNVPKHIHEHAGGLWPTGMNCFFQDRMWYVYPTFDTTRFDDETETLTIIRVPDRLYSSPECTFENEAGRLTIVATSASQMFDTTHLKYMTEGDGVRFVSADTVMDGWGEVKDNKIIAHRSKSNTEVRIEDKSTPDHFTRMSRSRITANPFLEYSNLAARKGQIATFLWENADFTLLRPGMMCKILYIRGEEIAELEGVLLNAQGSVQMFGEGMASNTFRTTCALFIFCNITEEVTS